MQTEVDKIVCTLVSGPRHRRVRRIRHECGDETGFECLWRREFDGGWGSSDL